MPDAAMNLNGRPVYVVDGARTPQLTAKGAPGPFAAADLAVGAGRPLLQRPPRAPVLLNEAMVTWLAQWNAARGVGARARALGKLRPAYLAPVIGLLRGLTDPLVGLNMGLTAEILANRFHIGREQMEAFALESHRRLAAAQDEGRLG